MNLETKIKKLLADGALRRAPDTLQGVTKERIEVVLAAIDRNNPDQVDTVFALLDDRTPNWFREAAQLGLKFSAGASTAHVGCHVGLLQRSSGKLDREGRDMWLKPLWEIGALEKIYWDPDKLQFLYGHPIAKSPNSSYRIAESFLAILTAPDDKWRALLAEWNGQDATRKRLETQALLAQQAKASVDTAHEQLIKAACDIYAAKFLPGYEVIYVDATDGDRVTDQDRERLQKAGITIKLGDSMPDALLWHPKEDKLWVIEAVTSDGEVDLHKVNGMTQMAARHKKKGIGFTTAYRTWRDAASRQGKHKNIAPDSYIWIQEDGSKQLKVEAFRVEGQLL